MVNIHGDVAKCRRIVNRRIEKAGMSMNTTKALYLICEHWKRYNLFKNRKPLMGV